MGHNTDNTDEQPSRPPFSNAFEMLDNLLDREGGTVALSVARNIRHEGDSSTYIQQVDGTNVLGDTAFENLIYTPGSHNKTHLELDSNSTGNIVPRFAGKNLVKQGKEINTVLKKGADPEVKHEQLPDSDNSAIPVPIEEENESLDESETDGGKEDSEKSDCFNGMKKSMGNFFRRLITGVQDINVQFNCFNGVVG